MTVLGLVDRDSGRSRLFHVEKGWHANSADCAGEPVPRSAANDGRAHDVSPHRPRVRRAFRGAPLQQGICARRHHHQHRRRRVSASSSAACAASTSIAPRSIFTAIWPSLSSATATAKRSAATTQIAPTRCPWNRRQAPDLSNNCCEGLMPKAKPLTPEEAAENGSRKKSESEKRLATSTQRPAEGAVDGW